MKKKRSVLILTADAGFGHRIVSNAVAAALLERHPEDCECILFNPLEDRRSPFFVRRSQRNYDKTVRDSKAFYLFTYDVTFFPVIRWVTKYSISLLLEKIISDEIEAVQPDVVLSTYLVYQAPLKAVISRRRRSIPFYTVITDQANVHPFWYQPCPDQLFVPNEAVCRQAVQAGVPAEKIIVSGIPVHPEYHQEKRTKAELRQELGWDPGMTTLFAVGSRRVSNLVANLEKINQCKLPLQLVVVAGGDDILYRDLRQVRWQIPTYLYNYVNNIPNMMLAADILLSKAGGLITTEGLACGLPILLIDFIPGQENGNVDYVCANQAGLYAVTPEELCQSLDRWLKNDQAELKQVAERSRGIGKPDAAYRVAEALWKS